MQRQLARNKMMQNFHQKKIIIFLSIYSKKINFALFSDL